jgi:MscS family membrane protein
MEVEIYAYFLVRDYADYLALQEDLLLNVADTLERTGAGVAFPAQTTILAKEVAVDPEKEKAAKTAIEAARKAGTVGGQMPSP